MPATGLMVAGDVDKFGLYQRSGSPGDAVERVLQSWGDSRELADRRYEVAGRRSLL